MVAALEMYFDPHAERRIRRLWTSLSLAGVPSMRDHTHRLHRPHLSLVVADALDPHAVAAALDGLTVAPPLRLSFQYAGQFVGRVLFLGPAPSADLLAHQATVHERVVGAGIDLSPLYTPAAWVPHCTLSMRVPNPMVAAAMRTCLEVLPIDASVTSAAVVDHNRGIRHPL